MDEHLPAFILEPQYREYVWGGSRLRPGKRTAEVWAVHEDNLIQSGPLTGQKLSQAAEVLKDRLLGYQPQKRTGTRFPLLIKLLDCAQWLSLQVHPNDQQAKTLEGSEQFGKTEAWHFLETDPGANILCGFQPGLDPEIALQSVCDGSVIDYAQYVPVQAGDTIFIKAGTLHALGPGLLVYEVQQTSDITYRVFDWNRPASTGRPLHIEQTLTVLNPGAVAEPIPQPEFVDGAAQRLLASDYFTLELLSIDKKPLWLSPGGRSFHALTVIEGQARLVGDGWQLQLERYSSAVVPAAAPKYQVLAGSRARLLKATVE